jgi:DNA-binding NtrC family response regulator
MVVRDISRNAETLRAQAAAMGVQLVGESPAFRALLDAIYRIATRGSPTILITGETGTGKELVARTLHYCGVRKECPFVPVNCGALPESLVENELFGHREGAFTGARRASTGVLQLAHRGTLFLDEVDALPLKAQAALLRFLEDGRFSPLGGGKEEYADVRIMAASNLRLEEACAAGRFRWDLYYRLDVIALEVPPLRMRQGDIAMLSRHFLRECVRRYDLLALEFHPKTLDWFNRYAWPGNIRELQNTVQRASLLCDADEIVIEAPSAITQLTTPWTASEPLPPYRAARASAVEAFDRQYLERLLRSTKGNVTKAASLCGKERRTLGKLIKRYGLRKDAFSVDS